MHRNNIRFQEGNKHEMYHFSHFIFTCAQVILPHTERAKCHMHAYHTRTNVFRPYARHTRTNKPERLCDKMQRFGKTKTHITMSAHKI